MLSARFEHVTAEDLGDGAGRVLHPVRDGLELGGVVDPGEPGVPLPSGLSMVAHEDDVASFADVEAVHNTDSDGVGFEGEQICALRLMIDALSAPVVVVRLASGTDLLVYPKSLTTS